MNRLSYGLKTAPSEFNRIMSQILQGLKGVDSYFDDIIVYAETLEECAINLRPCLDTFRDHDHHLNLQKCSFFTQQIKYLGYLIDKGKILQSPEKTAAVHEMKSPTNLEELRCVLELLTHYSRFIPTLSELIALLRKLLAKNQRLVWTAEQEAAFIHLKQEVCSERVLTPFDSSIPIILTTNASLLGIAAVLSHEINGIERPISYANRAFSQAEKNYLQLDREALVIIYGVQYFHIYIFGAKFILCIDNASLTRIFYLEKPLPCITPIPSLCISIGRL